MSVPHSSVSELARAVVKACGNAGLLDQDNRLIRWVSIDEAVESGGAFFVEPKSTLAVFDLDQDDLIPVAENLSAKVLERGLTPLWTASGRENHRHLYIYDPGGSSAVYDEARSSGLPPETFRKSGVRPPLSPHRLGLDTSLLGVGVEEALAILGPPEKGAQYGRSLPAWFDAVLSSPDPVNVRSAWNGERHRMAIAIASAMKTAGFDFDNFRLLMSNEASPLSEKYVEIRSKRGDADGWLRDTWENAIVYDGFDQDHVDRVAAAVDAHLWKGRGGTSQKSVMVTLCFLADQYRTTAPTFGVRNIALRSGLAVNTVRKALSALQESGWLTKVAAVRPGEADSYRLTIPDSFQTDTPITVPPAVIGVLVSQHPVFRNGSGLGKSCGLVYQALCDTPKSGRQLAEESGRHPTTVSRSLKTLEAFGLAAKAGGGWVACGSVEDLNWVAEYTGAADAAERQRIAYELQDRAFAVRFGDRSEPADDRRRTEEDHAVLA